ncbi:hypothetical protein [Acinetobacter nosocomialis]|uniref:hypothetical protein n=1 Tax=Acinetobacter nosocomialis TaxID=106654 RepID=UPI0029D723DF|nr:hypothetical protein [Acinetobacter nosocomialis]MDX7882129.1 hypothetical protein [Acinetobacter nosocomialis]
MLKIFSKKTILAIMIGANIVSMASVVHAGSKSSSRSSYSSSSSKSSSYSSSSRSSYTSTPSSSSYTSSARSSYTTSTPSKTSVYTPVTKTTVPKTAPYNHEAKKTSNVKASPIGNKSTGQSYSTLKNTKYKKGSSNFLSLVLLAWILSDSNDSKASTSTTKEVVVDCKQWLKDNPHKPNDLSNDEYQKIKKYCETIAK